MPAFIGGLGAVISYLGSGTVIAGLANTILINVALGGPQFTDEAGERWEAVSE